MPHLLKSILPTIAYSNLRGCKESVQDFYTRNPSRLGPHITFYDYDNDRELAVTLL
ncbi:hypothetical protein PTT_18005 [Pyrenophora teres f. teres 0-1]|uniref:Uncharacterized protein n=1 Tax=Pyrenophora teres f. teres (strain 0-1) TaxID=861557 RepID=E3S5R3_PYRTT|nr:hypothetical protein PTT_18005 [Pyrenophora teres f. teres 0-1]